MRSRALERASGAADTEVGAEALFLLARSQYRQGRQDQGRATFRRVADRFPDSRWAAEALFLVADLDHDAGDLTSAATLYRRVMQIAPTIEVGRVAGARLGGMRFIAGEYDRALESFRDLERGDAAAGAYWVGRTLSRLGREGKRARHGSGRWRQIRSATTASWRRSDSMRGAPC
jgi:tetratricopeptide (TPR) repeat protein